MASRAAILFVAMWIDRLSSVFAVLGLVALVAVVTLGVLSLMRWRQDDGSAIDAFEWLQPKALWMAWLTAFVMGFGSLYYALGAEYFDFPRRYFPNTLGWYQCICAIPLVAVLLVAAFRRDIKVWHYAAVPVVVGAIFAAYNAQLQAFTSQPADGKFTDIAAQRLVWKFGFMSLPLMALIGFVLIGLLLFAAQTAADEEEFEIIDQESEVGADVV